MRAAATSTAIRRGVSQRASADADVERPGDDRPDRAGRTDRRAALPARKIHARPTPLATAAALRFYAPGLIGYSIVKIASPTFYSLGNSRTPVIVSVGVGHGQPGAEHRAVPGHGLQRPGARHRHRRALQRHRRCCGCCGARLGGLEGRRVTIALREDRAAALVMGVAAARRGGAARRAAAGIREVMRGAARRDRDRRRARRPRRLGTPAADRGIHRRDRAGSPPRASRPPLIAARRVPSPASPHGAVRRLRPLRRRRIRQHLRAAAAAADPTARTCRSPRPGR